MGCVCVRYDKRSTFEISGDYNTFGLLSLKPIEPKVIEKIREWLEMYNLF